MIQDLAVFFMNEALTFEGNFLARLDCRPRHVIHLDRVDVVAVVDCDRHHFLSSESRASASAPCLPSVACIRLRPLKNEVSLANLIALTPNYTKEPPQVPSARAAK